MKHHKTKTETNNSIIRGKRNLKKKEKKKTGMVSPSGMQRVYSLIPNSVCSLYFSRSIWMLVLKKSNLALSC